MTWEIATVAVMIGTIGFLSYFAKNLDRDQWHLKFGFFLISFFIMLSTMNYGRVLAEDNGASTNVLNIFNTAYNVLFYVCIFVTFYIFILFMMAAVKSWNTKKKGDSDNELENIIAE